MKKEAFLRLPFLTYRRFGRYYFDVVFFAVVFFEVVFLAADFFSVVVVAVAIYFLPYI